MNSSLPANTWILIPVYNEERSLGSVLEELIPLGAQIVVIDDGSTDGSRNVAERFPVHRIHHPYNLGQGAALQTGFDYALKKGAQYLVTFDADHQMNASDIPRLCAPLASGEADVCLGNRFTASSNVPPMRSLLLKIGAWMLNGFFHLGLEDIQNGLRAFDRKTIEQLHITQNRMAHASQILRQLALIPGLRIRQVPVTIHYSSQTLRKGQRNTDLIHILWDLMFH